jgi:hypothetical protein
MRAHPVGMKSSIHWKQEHAEIIQAIERRLNPRSTVESVERPSPVLIAEWQPRGPETVSGLAFRKLRLTFASPPSTIGASAAAKEAQP